MVSKSGYGVWNVFTTMIEGASSYARTIRIIGGLMLCAVLMGNADEPRTHTFGDPGVWQRPPSRTYHVENYKLTLHFDQQKGEVFGDEVVTLRPFASGFRRFFLDSSDLTIDAVTLETQRREAVSLTYAIEHPRLWITLDHDYDATSSLNVRIVYHGLPSTGLFFVNPTQQDPESPSEVYSQGEPEFNHHWFPCWDYPNDLATSETITTVPEGQIVVSNGKLVRETHAAGQVTYDWVESIPHSSYLISIAVGPWRKVTDHYHDKPVDYYVPLSVDEATARRSFDLTPDMIAFFSRATGVEYPYEQYAQTTVHNFLYGGQENVSATTLTESTLHDERADADYPSTELVSHELGQHWFGDFVQGRDWANIWLNEGFATWLSALYTQHHAGNDAYRLEIYDDQETEQLEGRADYLRPIVDQHYTDPMQMFDATTHEKGAAVLDMLRYVVDGPAAMSHPASQDELLFQALQQYLLVHHAQDADTADLIAAIRATTGQELDWFFREWVFLAGHPKYRVEAHYDSAAKIERVTVAQTQTVDEATPLFDMPVELAFFGKNGERKVMQVQDNAQKQDFDIPLDFEPEWVDFDPDGIIDKYVQFDKPLNALIAEAEKDPSMMSRVWATNRLGEKKGADTPASIEALGRVLETDGFYAVRAAAATGLGNIGGDRAESVLLSALQPDSRVRTAVVRALGHFSRDARAFAALSTLARTDSSYAVEAAAAEALGKSGMPQAFDNLQTVAATKPEVHVMRATLLALAATRDPRAAAILLEQSRPGVAERIRLTALHALASTSIKESVQRAHAEELEGVVGAALCDPFLPTRRAGEELVGDFALTQFRGAVQRSEENGSPILECDEAQTVLKQRHGSAPGH